ncbi:MAG: hypothetical protein KAJ19_20140 [Gammaproteobacteria bacterium]|nr:hypothetical protein [Gammaproteobacteria bacterium]
MSSFRLPEQITYWIPITHDVTGGKTWGVGILVAARIASHVEEIIDPEGKTVRTKKAVYTRVNLPPGTYVFEGDESGRPAPFAGSERVMQSITIPSMSDMSRMLI